MKSKYVFYPFFICLLSLGASAAAATAHIVDLGPASGTEGNDLITVTVALKLRDSATMEARLAATYTEGGPEFHKFLTPAQFSEAFGPSPEDLTLVINHFKTRGFAVSRTATSLLQITGTVAALETEFGAGVHTFEIPNTGHPGVMRFRAATAPLQIASDIAPSVHGVVGFDTRRHFHPLSISSSNFAAGKLAHATFRSSGTTNPPGSLTVRDVAQYYDVVPLYQHGLDGHGVTIGVVMFASMTESDAYAYWSALGLNVDPDRITEVPVDGGAGPPSDLNGSFETTLDVEQSGGLAPGAKILVYEAPGSNQGGVDAVAAAVEDNRADTISLSWGSWDYLDQLNTASGGAVTDPRTGEASTMLRAFDGLFAQAALQGQSVYVATGDAGAFLSDYFYFPPSWPLPPHAVVPSVSDPAVSRWVTAVGGTTLPVAFVVPVSATQNVTISVPEERAWGEDYLEPVCTALALDPLSCGIFPAGGGGGVSPFMPIPFYQVGIPGIRKTGEDWMLLDYTQVPPATVVNLPSGFAGRNIPDISLNADPNTGFVLYYTSPGNGFSILSGDGGTSFTAPQMSGVTALFDQAKGRIGLLNPYLYSLVRRGNAYGGPNAPLRDIASGDNWFFHARPGYDQGTGLGVPDFWNLFRALPSSGD